MKQVIPFWLAVLININIVVGAGFFLVVQKISMTSGILAPLAWLFCGLLLLPFVNAIAQLSQRFPRAGGICVFSTELLGDAWGIISGWAYYIGTSAANAYVGHALTQALMQLPGVHAFITVYGVSPLACDLFVVTLFTFLNLRNVDFLEKAQLLFTSLKMIPLLAIVVALPLLFSWDNLLTGSCSVASVLPTLPKVFFAYIGIEACCSVMDKIEDAKKNAARLIFTSFAAIVAIYGLLQLIALSIHGVADVDAFLSLPGLLCSNSYVAAVVNYAIRLGLLASYLAGFYGVFYFNNWNLYAMVKEMGIKQVGFLTKLNKAQVPWVAVLVQSFLVMLFLGYWHMDDVCTLADVGTGVAYMLTAVAFFTWKRSLVALLAVASCSTLLYFLAQNLIAGGLSVLAPAMLMMTLGVGFFTVLKRIQ
jgi:amino acid transporter